MKNMASLFFVLLLMTACNANQSAKNDATSVKIDIPAFNADSAYTYTADQVGFGPRVPNTQAHVNCGKYLSEQLKRFGAQVTNQEVTLKTYDNIELKAQNIIGSFQPENKNRILLFAHWDTRPFADQDPDPANHRKPIDGANDGAGACAALLEMARQIGIKQPSVGVDIIFFDAEDWGVPTFDEKNQNLSGWCLGSDYWSKNPHVLNYTARFGILLDMVSAPGAQFYKEYYSMKSAKDVVKKVWNAAKITGYDSYFIDKDGGAVEDDHVHVIENRQIPCIDIIHYDPTNEHRFGDYWHTMNDNMTQISKETLRAVGQTVLYVVYNEK